MSSTNILSMTGAVTVSTALDLLAATDDRNTGATIPLNALAGSGAVNVREAGGRGLPLVKVGGPGSYSGTIRVAVAKSIDSRSTRFTGDEKEERCRTPASVHALRAPGMPVSWFVIPQCEAGE